MLFRLVENVMRFTLRFHLEYQYGSRVKDDSRRSSRKLSLKSLLCFVSSSRVWNRIVRSNWFLWNYHDIYTREILTDDWKLFYHFLKLSIHLKFIHLFHLHLTFMKIILCANTSKNHYILLISSFHKMNILEHRIRFRWHKIDLFLERAISKIASFRHSLSPRR